MTKRKVKYPYFDMPFEGREIRKHVWMYTNRPTFHRSPTESWKMVKNYVTDGYSIPWPWKIAIQKGKANKNKAGFHDLLCEYGKDGRIKISSELVHQLFDEMSDAWIWFEEDQEFRKIVPDFDAGMTWAVKHFGPKWKFPNTTKGDKDEKR